MTTISAPPRVALAVALVLIGFNMRPALTSLAPVLNEVMAATGLSATGASALTTLPVLCLGIFAAGAPWIGRRLGLEQGVIAAMGAMALGLGLRGLGGVAALVAGSLLAGAAIGIGNVLVPGLLKRDFADRAAVMTGTYITALGIGAVFASGATAPIYRAAGNSWQAALLVWAIPAVLAMLAAAWVWRGRIGKRPPRLAAGTLGVSLWRVPLAWQVTLFMGLQSMAAYIVFGWLAPILRSRGDTAVQAGLVVSVAVFAQMACSLPAPVLAARLKQQSWACVASQVGAVVGFLGLVAGPLELQWVFAVVCGLGTGAAFAIAVLLMVLRAPNAPAAARLSSMAQTVGYCLAAMGPLVVGVLHDMTGDWTGAAAVELVAGTTAAVAGYLAGRNQLVPG